MRNKAHSSDLHFTVSFRQQLRYILRSILQKPQRFDNSISYFFIMSAASRTLNLSPLDLIPSKYFTKLALSFETTEAVECVLPKLQVSLDKTCHSIPWLGGKLVPTTEKEMRRARAASEL